MSPSAIYAWEKDIWISNKHKRMLCGNWKNDVEFKRAATRAAMAHREKGDWKLSAAILIWLGDVRAAVIDCIAKSGYGGYAQFAILVQC